MTSRVADARNRQGCGKYETDGGCRQIQGRVVGAILTFRNVGKELAGTDPETTNNAWN